MRRSWGYPPPLEVLADKMDLPLRKAKIVRRAIKALRAPNQQPTDRDGSLVEMSDLVADSREAPPDTRALQSEELRTLRQLLEAIDDREAKILRLRFGMDGQEPMTLKEIASQVGISRERVRQIVDESLTKLNGQLTDNKPSRFFRRSFHEGLETQHAIAPA
ncbi:MAG: sigma-70 family RNA polymerase sigma factor [Planctomycetota bacterium]